jgi:hypothetical protein
LKGGGGRIADVEEDGSSIKENVEGSDKEGIEDRTRGKQGVRRIRKRNK